MSFSSLHSAGVGGGSPVASLGALHTAGVTSLAPSGVVSAGVGGGASADTLHSADAFQLLWCLFLR